MFGVQTSLGNTGLNKVKKVSLQKAYYSLFPMLLNLFGQRTFDQTSMIYNTIWEMCHKLIGVNIRVRIDLLVLPTESVSWEQGFEENQIQKRSDLSEDGALSCKVEQSTVGQKTNCILTTTYITQELVESKALVKWDTG